MPKKSKKKLIVNADDFGLTEGVNRGIIHCFQNGIVSSTSLMANGIAFDDAASLYKKNPDLGIGWHAVLVGEKPILLRNNINSLVNSQGRFLDTHVHFMAKYFSGRINSGEVLRELESQLLKILNNGIVPDHINSHQFIHMLPVILRIVISLAKKYGIRYIRFPDKELFQVFNIKGIGLFSLAGISYPQICDSGLNYAQRVLGLKKSCRMNESDLLGYLDACPEGLSELMCHPGFMDETYRRHYSHWKVNRPEEEIYALTSKKVKENLKSLDIELVNYRLLQNI